MIKILGWLALAAFILVAGCFVIAGDEEDSLGKVILVSHQQECYGEECYRQEYDYDYGNHGDNSRNRERGAFSPGPFDDSPVDAFNNACLPGATCYYERNPDGQGPEQQPRRYRSRW